MVRGRRPVSRCPARTVRLRDEGLWLDIAGNQTVRAGSLLRGLGLPADMIATSDDWGVSKPSLGFFRKMIEVSPFGPGEILYVGDRLDNDIMPAARLGLRTALINRGPWAMIWQDDPAASRVRRCGLTRWPSCPARSPRLTLERAEGGLPAIEPVIEMLHALPLRVWLEGLADFENPVHAGRVPGGAELL